MSGKVTSKILICSRCEREYDHVQQPCTAEFCQVCYAAVRRARLKQRCLDYLGGKCLRCGYNRCTQALEFHHLRDKTMQIGDMIKRFASWARLQAELDKCEILCANCHAEHHAGYVEV